MPYLHCSLLPLDGIQRRPARPRATSARGVAGARAKRRGRLFDARPRDVPARARRTLEVVAAPSNAARGRGAATVGSSARGGPPRSVSVTTRRTRGARAWLARVLADAAAGSGGPLQRQAMYATPRPRTIGGTSRRLDRPARSASRARHATRPQPVAGDWQSVRAQSRHALISHDSPGGRARRSTPARSRPRARTRSEHARRGVDGVSSRPARTQPASQERTPWPALTLRESARAAGLSVRSRSYASAAELLRHRREQLAVRASRCAARSVRYSISPGSPSAARTSAALRPRTCGEAAHAPPRRDIGSPLGVAMCSSYSVAVGVLGHRQEVEDPAAAVVDADDRQVDARAARRRPAPPRSWISASSPVSSQPRPPVPSAAPAADDTTPSIPFAPRLARNRTRRSLRGKNVSTSRIGIDDATHTERALGQRAAEPRSSVRLERLRRRGERLRHELVRAPPASIQPRSRRAGSRCSSTDASISSVGTGVGVRRSSRPRGSARARRACGSIDHLPSRPRAMRAAACEVGVSPTRSTSSGALRGGPARRPQQHVVVGDHVRAVVRPAAHARTSAPPAPASRPPPPAARPAAIGPGSPSARRRSRRAATPRPLGELARPASRSGRASVLAHPHPRRPVRRAPASRPRRAAPSAPARAARAAGSSGAPARAARRRRSPTRGRRARGGGPRSRARRVVADLDEPLRERRRTA